MAEITIQEVRAKFPQYDDMSDEQLGAALHKKYYSDIPQEQFFSQIGLGVKPESSMRDKAQAVGEVSDTVISSMIAEPVAGLVGLATGMQGNLAKGLERQGFQGAADFVKPDRTPEQALNQTKEAMIIQPKSELGKEYLGNVGKVLEPVAKGFEKAESTLGDAVYNKTGSATLAALATTAPTLAIELTGVALSKGALKQAQHSKMMRENGMIARGLDDAVPTQEQLFDLGSQLYKEVDDVGAVVKANKYTDLVNAIERQAYESGYNPALSPKTSVLLDEMRSLSSMDVPISQLDTFRKMTKSAASSPDALDASLGMMVKNNIDDFLDNASVATIKYGGADPKLLGKKLKTARDLWARARKSELIDEAFTRADLARSGRENGIRQEFARLLRNKKTRKLFTPDEIAAIKAVESGDGKGNLAKIIGRFGLSEGKATNVVGAGVGAAAGGAVGGVPAAVAVTGIGQVSRNLAQKLTMNNALYADKVIRAGKDGNKIIKAYYQFTPKAERSAEELSQLLMTKDIDYKSLQGDEMVKQAARLAAQAKAQQAGAVVTGAGLSAKETTSENK